MSTIKPLIRDADCLNTPTTRRLRRHVEALAARNPDIEDTVRQILADDHPTLLRLVHAAQAGDSDAALIAITSLLPRMTGTIIKTVPAFMRRRAIEEYLSLAYLVILDVGRREPADHLAQKIVARTKLRYERHLRALTPARVCPSLLIEEPVSASDTEAEAVSRLDLAHVADAVDRGLVSPEQWRLVTAAGLGTLDAPLSERQRQTVLRTRRKLAYWYTKAEAA
jgi:hypothetical protein